LVRTSNRSQAATHSSGQVPVVAIGASAGGLKALTEFFKSVPPHPGVAFVVVLHLEATSESHLSEILAQVARMPVTPVGEPTVPRPDHVYVLPPDRTLVLDDGKLVPYKRTEPPGLHHPVDELFKSVAAGLRTRAIAIVLSGTGTDGTRGAPAVREEGGLVIAQDPDTAEFREMPENAIATGTVDRVMAPDAMSTAIDEYLSNLELTETSAAQELAAPTNHFEALLALLRHHSGIDFGNYKTATLMRRIHRRAGLSNTPNLADYLHLVRERPKEREALLNDLLITVTRFKRDPEAWADLAEHVIKPLVSAQSANNPIRAWVPGCASGEEAYYLAILIAEESGRQSKPFLCDIFATDVSEAALSVARAGVYPLPALQELLSSERKYFILEGDHARISPKLRGSIIFARHNVIQDPPFSQLDLIICRNVFIYFKPEVQKRVARLFHFALREGGTLFLGSAEGLEGLDHLFQVIAKPSRIYRRIGPRRADSIEFPAGADRMRLQPVTSEALGRPFQLRIADVSLRALADRHAPASVVIDQQMEVLYFHGDTRKYLAQPPGETTRNILALANERMRSALRSAIRNARKTGAPVTAIGHLAGNGAKQNVEIEVSPVPNGRDRGLLLVSFRSGPPVRRQARPKESPSSRERELELEVLALGDELRNVRQEAQATQEDLKASNEEVVSMNEELRSSNEELETSKEELQSLNEELSTLNAQLRHKLDELQQSTSDLRNLLTSSGIATLFLDRALRVRWYSPAAAPLFNLLDSDVGRPITDLVSRLTDGSFADDCRAVQEQLAPLERQVQGSTGETYLRRVTAYRNADDRIDGVVVSFLDVTGIQEARDFAEKIVETVPMPLIVLSKDLKVVFANEPFFALFGVEPDETYGRRVFEIGKGHWNIPELKHLLEDVLPSRQSFEGHLVEQEFESIGTRAMLLSGRQIDHVQLVLLAIEDITERRSREEQQKVLVAELSHRVKNALAVVQALASQTAAHCNSLEEFQDVFGGRLRAFAKAHSQLIERAWEGGDLKSTIEDALSVHAVNREHIVITEGPAISMKPRAALALNMILHELATNALKYGALSTEAGLIRISWNVIEEKGGRTLHLYWQESGGPAVKLPKNKGFGTKLIEQSMAFDLRGKVHLGFDPGGLRCELVFAC
jgi:two-component system CheB/CheR fusion protein